MKFVVQDFRASRKGKSKLSALLLLPIYLFWTNFKLQLEHLRKYWKVAILFNARILEGYTKAVRDNLGNLETPWRLRRSSYEVIIKRSNLKPTRETVYEIRDRTLVSYLRDDGQDRCATWKHLTRRKNTISRTSICKACMKKVLRVIANRQRKAFAWICSNLHILLKFIIYNFTFWSFGI